MQHHQHKSSNDVLHSPAGMTVEQCRPLPVTRVHYIGDDTYGVASFWRPSPEELKLLIEGKSVRLVIQGHTHPPVYVGVDGDGVIDI